MQKTDQTESRVEKVIKKKREKFCVKWKGYDKITYYMHICLIAGYIKMMSPYKMSFIPEPNSHIKHKMKTELDLSNYATKSELKQAAGVDTWGFAKTASLKSDVNKLDIDKLKTISTDLSKLRKAVDNYFVKETLYDRFIARVSAFGTSESVQKTDYNTTIEEIEQKILNHEKNVITPEFNILKRKTKKISIKTKKN